MTRHTWGEHSFSCVPVDRLAWSQERHLPTGPGDQAKIVFRLWPALPQTTHAKNVLLPHIFLQFIYKITINSPVSKEKFGVMVHSSWVCNKTTTNKANRLVESCTKGVQLQSLLKREKLLSGELMHNYFKRTPTSNRSVSNLRPLLFWLVWLLRPRLSRC